MTAPALSNWGKLREPRIGIMMHYDGSASDRGAVQWLKHDRRAKVSYTYLVLDDGTIVEIAPEDARAWHAGACRPSRSDLRYRDANSAFYGIALAAKPGDKATPAAFAAVVVLCRRLMKQHGWTEPWRITTHKAEAWPRGRKIDPDGVLDVEAVRKAVLA
jgi:N-acetylmuramoyl-L-alanine amidase